jgi:hypothetical protein
VGSVSPGPDRAWTDLAVVLIQDADINPASSELAYSLWCVVELHGRKPNRSLKPPFCHRKAPPRPALAQALKVAALRRGQARHSPLVEAAGVPPGTATLSRLTLLTSQKR